MALEINWRPEVGKKVEEFFDDPGYKEYLESAVSFNRKLNEERKMRLPYIDSQTGVAQRHYNSERNKRERMPGIKPGQVYSYPQKAWRKKKYQYLKYFMQAKRFDPEAEMHTISQIENPSALQQGTVIPPNEDSNTSGGQDGKDWPYYDEDGFLDDGENEVNNSDSDFEYEDSYSRKRKSKGGGKGSGRPKGGSKVSFGGGVSGMGSGASGGGSGGKRRTHADNIPDSEKPFSCELCGARYKTRPGLSYHYNHSHREKGSEQHSNEGVPDHEEGPSGPSSVGAASLTPPSTPGVIPTQESSNQAPPEMAGAAGTPTRTTARRQGMPYSDTPPMGYPREEEGPIMTSGPPPPSSSGAKRIMVDGKERAAPTGYCDFCLGDANENKKSGRPEEMVSCAECGRSGHPTCLQFTDNMIVSVRKYPWQCIECKCCTLCGTSEHDEQLLFCDDCDRGYHMYCLVPPIKEPPEGSWSCNLCIETFHRK